MNCKATISSQLSSHTVYVKSLYSNPAISQKRIARMIFFFMSSLTNISIRKDKFLSSWVWFRMTLQTHPCSPLSNTQERIYHFHCNVMLTKVKRPNYHCIFLACFSNSKFSLQPRIHLSTNWVWLLKLNISVRRITIRKDHCRSLNLEILGLSGIYILF